MSAARALTLVLTILLSLAVPAAPAAGAPAAVPTADRAEAGQPDGIWAWPLGPDHDVVALFDHPDTVYSAGHRGIDITASSPTVTAVDDGVIAFAGPVAGKPVVTIRHANGLVSTYEPVLTQRRAGEAVRRGDVIGELDGSGGFSHCGDVPCLHLGAKRTGVPRELEYLDPLPLLGVRGPSVLLPRSSAEVPAHAAAAPPTAPPRVPVRPADAPGRWWSAASPL